MDTKSGGFLSGVEIMSKKIDDSANLNVNALHRMLGHTSEAVTRKTAKSMGHEVTGTFQPCSSCGIGKAKQKNVCKKSEGRATEKGERFCMDISHIKATSFGGAKFWNLIVDEATDMKWCIFLKKKSDLKYRMKKFLNLMINKYDIHVKKIRCDNAGENKKVMEMCEKEKGLEKIEFEFTSRDSPQYNGTVERAFATLYGKIRACNNWARFTKKYCLGLWAECAQYCCDVENVLIKGEKSAFYKFFGKESKIIKEMGTFGEIGIVKTKTKMQGKLSDRGTPCIMTGYAKNHGSGVFRMMNMETYKILMT